MRGLNFTPTPAKNHIELKSDIHAFTRKLRLTEFFHSSEKDKERNDPNDSLVKPKAHFNPPRNRSKELDRQIDFLNNLELQPNANLKSNFSKQEWIELRKLQNNPDIITTLKDRVSTYKQHIKQPQYQQIKVEEHLRTCGEHKFNIFPFFKIKEENKILRESYEDHFIKKFKPKLNARI